MQSKQLFTILCCLYTIDKLHRNKITFMSYFFNFYKILTCTFQHLYQISESAFLSMMHNTDCTNS